jgi:glycosyltransferase involved in cell wall biosynthesis
MAMSCPVIVSPDVGAAHLVESSGAGLVVNCEPMFLGDAARKLATNPELRRVLGERGTKFVAERLSWSAVAVEAERAYRRAIERTARQQVAIA